MLSCKRDIQFLIVLITFTYVTIFSPPHSLAKPRYFQIWRYLGTEHEKQVLSGKIELVRNSDDYDNQNIEVVYSSQGIEERYIDTAEVKAKAAATAETNTILIFPDQARYYLADVKVNQNTMPNTLLLDQYLSNGPSIQEIESELNSNSIFFINIPPIHLSDTEPELIPLFQFVHVQEGVNGAMILAKPLSCNCPPPIHVSGASNKVLSCPHSQQALITIQLNEDNDSISSIHIASSSQVTAVTLSDYEYSINAFRTPENDSRIMVILGTILMSALKIIKQGQN